MYPLDSFVVLIFLYVVCELNIKPKVVIEKLLSVTKRIITNKSSILAAVHMIVDGQQVPERN